MVFLLSKQYIVRIPRSEHECNDVDDTCIYIYMKVRAGGQVDNERCTKVHESTYTQELMKTTIINCICRPR
jgi:hypothetical protein